MIRARQPSGLDYWSLLTATYPIPGRSKQDESWAGRSGNLLRYKTKTDWEKCDLAEQHRELQGSIWGQNIIVLPLLYMFKENPDKNTPTPKEWLPWLIVSTISFSREQRFLVILLPWSFDRASEPTRLECYKAKRISQTIRYGKMLISSLKSVVVTSSDHFGSSQ